MAGLTVAFFTGIVCLLLIEATGLPNGLPIGLVIAAAYIGGRIAGRTA